ncbi:MAG: TraB/GumN family protein [Flavobacterium sp.]|nr:TraB/GumN family protein [Flavobacterium sp.]
MKKLLILPFLLFTSVLFAQNEKTLFWEISGKGLTKKSYLYGTMHVNDKVSYHLSDAFFKNLLAADIVSNESDPETWNDVFELIRGQFYKAPESFYSTFYMSPVKTKELNLQFTNNNYFNNMLSGIEGGQADYQENTVLDMFIYQTGRKYKKRIVGLESAKTSLLSIMKIKHEDSQPEPKNRDLLMKIIKSGNFNETLKQYYREKDIVMLDSIYKLMFSKKGHDVMITNRNVIMARSIDSLAKTGSLFSAIGAAHLSGKKGVIQLLKDKGYTVLPIIDVFSNNGEKQKKTIEDYFPNPGFKEVSTQDEMIKMPLNKNQFKINQNIGSLDFTNGGAITIKRLPLNYFLDKKNRDFNPKTLDSLFFENIAGTIIEKNVFQQENFVGYDIKNATKNGNKQHWKFYITPLELIVVSMTGSGNYVKQFENEVFDGIKIKNFKNTWDKISPKNGDFSVEVPAFNFIYGTEQEIETKIEIQAFDNQEKAHYFLTENKVNDASTLEDTNFELKQLQDEFYLQHDIEGSNFNFTTDKKSCKSESKIGTKIIRLKTVIDGNKYYLMGTVDASEINSNKFFDSFIAQKTKFNLENKTFTDTIAKFKIDIPEKPNQKIFLDLDTNKSKLKNKFLSKSVVYNFNSENGETIDFDYYKYHKYQQIDNLDSIAVNFKKHILKEYDLSYSDYNYDHDYGQNTSKISLLNPQFYIKKGFSKSKWDDLIATKEDKYEIISESKSIDNNSNIHIFNAVVGKSNSSQAIKYKLFFTGDASVEMSVLVDKNYKNDNEFIEKTFNTFVPTQKNTTSVFDDKLKVFMEDANSQKDTIRYSAMKSVNELKINTKDLDPVINFLTTFKFKPTENEAIEYLIEKIGYIQDSRVIPFLENFYKKESTKTATQISILKALSNQKSKLGYQKILDLLDYDLPVSDNDYDISNLFVSFKEDTDNSKFLFPKIMDYYAIKEYSEPLLDFCNTLFDRNLIAPKKLNSYKKIILTNTKLEYKRMVSWKEKNPNPDEISAVEAIENPLEDITENEEAIVDTTDNEAVSEVISASDAPTEHLINYLNLISNFQQDDVIIQLLNKIKKLDLPQLNSELIRLGIVNNTWNDEQIKEALNNSKTRFLTIQLLLNNNKNIGLSEITDDEIVQAAIVNFEDLKEKDGLKLLEKRQVDFHGKPTVYYFYEVSKKAEKPEVPVKMLYSIAFGYNNNKINADVFKVFPQQKIVEEKDLAKKYQTIITKSLNENHSRATFQKENSDENYYPDENY